MSGAARERTPRPRARVAARIAGASLLAHALVLGATPWIEIRLPAVVLAERAAAERELALEDEPVFVLDLRTTALLEVPDEPVPVVAGVPDAVEPPAEEPVVAPEPAPEMVLETAQIAQPDAAPVELEPEPAVVVPPEIADAEPTETPAAPGEDEGPPAVADVAPAMPAGAGRRAPSALVGAWIATAATWSAGAASAPAAPSASAASTGGPRATAGEDAAAAAPRLLEAPKPVYPDACRRRGVEGTTLCRMHVDARGDVGRVDVVETSGDERLDRAAVRALERWRFDPPRRAGTRIASQVLHRVSFRLTSRR